MVFFEDLSPDQVHDYGGKAINLARLHQLGVRVPKGFVIPSHGFIQFTNQEEFSEFISFLRKEDKDIETILESTKVFFHTASQLPIPPHIVKEIIRGLHLLESDQLNPPTSYAVRSSASVEDTHQTSFAGQADSFLCVSEIPSILEAVKRTWLSAFSPRSILYLQGKGIPFHEIRMGVIIQEMVIGEISGVMFTANVSTGDRNQLLIDANWGLGETIVAGKVKPDSFILQKNPLKVLHRHLGEKRLHSTPSPPHQPRYTQLSETPVEKRKIFSLSETQLFELAQLGLHIEHLFGTPQDVEWTFRNGQFVILQTRPITTI